MVFERLIRFEDEDGKVVYGNLEKETSTKEIEGLVVEVIGGDLESGFTKTDQKATVKKLLCPIPSTPIFMCIGLNYRHHAEEANLKVPPYPVVFTKPPDALAGPLEPIPIPPSTQSMLDYEGELTFIISRTGRDIPEVNALDYVLGYTAGNDLSARHFQLPDTSGGQFCYAKSFDRFAPIGPAIVSPSLIKDPQKLKYVTTVNGEVRQETGTDDMIWSVKQIVAHLSRGTTLRAGTVVMTGTPSGVGFFREPKTFLRDGDVVEVNVDGIGSIVNKMVFDEEA